MSKPSEAALDILGAVEESGSVSKPLLRSDEAVDPLLRVVGTRSIERELFLFETGLSFDGFLSFDGSGSEATWIFGSSVPDGDADSLTTAFAFRSDRKGVTVATKLGSRSAVSGVGGGASVVDPRVLVSMTCFTACMLFRDAGGVTAIFAGTFQLGSDLRDSKRLANCGRQSAIELSRDPLPMENVTVCRFKDCSSAMFSSCVPSVSSATKSIIHQTKSMA